MDTIGANLDTQDVDMTNPLSTQKKKGGPSKDKMPNFSFTKSADNIFRKRMLRALKEAYENR